MPHDQPAVLAQEAGLLAASPWVTRRRLTVAEYHRMGEVGILSHRDAVELIEGELVLMAPVGSGHSGTVNRLNRALTTAIGDRGVVAPQNPVRLDDHSEPQPDFAVLKPRDDFYVGATPRPQDVLLMIEVADSSLAYDREVKRALYARHGLPELWIVDLQAGRIEVCRAPAPDGYAEVASVGRGETIEIGLLPGVAIAAASVLG